MKIILYILFAFIFINVLKQCPFLFFSKVSFSDQSFYYLDWVPHSNLVGKFYTPWEIYSLHISISIYSFPALEYRIPPFWIPFSVHLAHSQFSKT